MNLSMYRMWVPMYLSRSTGAGHTRINPRAGKPQTLRTMYEQSSPRHVCVALQGMCVLHSKTYTCIYSVQRDGVEFKGQCNSYKSTTMKPSSSSITSTGSVHTSLPTPSMPIIIEASDGMNNVRGEGKSLGGRTSSNLQITLVR